MSQLIELNLRPDQRTLRQFGWLALVGFSLLAGAAWCEVWVFARGLGAAKAPVALVLLAIALLSAICSLFYPRANRLLYVSISILGYPIGLVVSYLVLGVLFYGVFGPVGVLLRVFGRDPMQRDLQRDRDSYWQTTRPARDKRDYFRQF